MDNSFKITPLCLENCSRSSNNASSLKLIGAIIIYRLKRMQRASMALRSYFQDFITADQESSKVKKVFITKYITAD